MEGYCHGNWRDEGWGDESQGHDGRRWARRRISHRTARIYVGERGKRMRALRR
jgi:hypothetical protein